MDLNKINNLVSRSLEVLKESKKIGEESLSLALIKVEEDATEDEKESLFNLQKEIDEAIKNGDLEAVKKIQSKWHKKISN